MDAVTAAKAFNLMFALEEEYQVDAAGDLFNFSNWIFESIAEGNEQSTYNLTVDMWDSMKSSFAPLFREGSDANLESFYRNSTEIEKLLRR